MTAIIDGESLTIESILAVAYGAMVALTDDVKIIDRVRRSRAVMDGKVESGEQVYGVTTLFGAMADQYVSPQQLLDAQECDGHETARSRCACGYAASSEFAHRGCLRRSLGDH